MPFVNISHTTTPDERVDGLVKSHQDTAASLAETDSWVEQVEAASAATSALVDQLNNGLHSLREIVADLAATVSTLPRECTPIDIKPLQDRLAALEEQMNNRDKQEVIDYLNQYWLEKHPDCFLEYADGRRVFRRELLDYKHDTLLTEIYNRKPPEPAPAQFVVPRAAKPAMWPMWVTIAALFVMEVLHYV